VNSNSIGGNDSSPFSESVPGTRTAAFRTFAGIPSGALSVTSTCRPVQAVAVLLLRLGSPVQALTGPGHVIDLADQESIDALYTDPTHDWDEFDLAPGHLMLCAASQPLRLGAAFAAAIASLSHLARVGLATHITSPWVMPGWDGHLTLELLNTGPATLRLHRDMPVARAVIWRMDGAARQAVPHGHYGLPANLGSRYAAEFGGELTANGTGA
jgi:deoxycytidine triphosphate deaminase